MAPCSSLHTLAHCCAGISDALLPGMTYTPRYVVEGDTDSQTVYVVDLLTRIRVPYSSLQNAQREAFELNRIYARWLVKE